MKVHLQSIKNIINDSNNQGQMTAIELIGRGFQYLVFLSELPGQVFKLCVEFWNEFTTSLVKQNNTQIDVLSKEILNPALSQITNIMIYKMAKPVEFLLTIDETGKPVRQHGKNTENNSLYEVMKELFINLIQLDWTNTKSLIVSKFENQINGSEFSFNNLNSICWVCGLLSDFDFPPEEQNLFTEIIKGLFSLSEQNNGPDFHTVTACDFMYVVGQFPKLLRSNWELFRSVLMKLFQLLHETYPAVMETAVNTFLKIATTCKDELVISHPSADNYNQEDLPFISQLIPKIPDQISPLGNEFKFIFYEAIGQIVSGEKVFERKQLLLKEILQGHWDMWDKMFQQVTVNNESLKDEQFIEHFHFIIKVHERLAYAVGADFFDAFTRIYYDFTRLYLAYSKLISNEVKTNRQMALNHYIVKKVQNVKKEIIKLIITVVEKSNDANIASENFMNSLLEILEDYCVGAPEIREAEVLLLFGTLTKKLQGNIAYLIPKLLENVMGVTLSQLENDSNNNRDNFASLFKLILSIVENCFQALFSISPELFKTILDCIVLGVNNEVVLISDSAAEALLQLLKNVNNDQNIANQFYQCYHLNILQGLLSGFTESGPRKSGLKMFADLLSLLFQVIASDYVNISLSPGQNIGNKDIVYQYFVEFSLKISTISKEDLNQYILLFFNVCGDTQQFQTSLKEYLARLLQCDPEVFEESQEGQGSEL